MLVIPNNEPVLANLNSYYLRMERFCEHCQGEWGSGGIHLKSPSSEGMIFFDKDEILNGIFIDKKEEEEGKNAVKALLEAAGKLNFLVNVYRLSSEEVCYWASMPAAEKIYSDLSTEFTDLERLMKKMSDEKLTGFIEGEIGKGSESGAIFFHSGKILGGSYSWNKLTLTQASEEQERFIRKTKEVGGVFHVSRIPLSGPPPRRSGGNGAEPPPDALELLAQLLRSSEKMMESGRKNKEDFGTFLRKKFIQKVDRYPFLDPFAAEFSYADGKVAFTGKASGRELLAGILQCLREMAAESNLIARFEKETASWSRRHARELRGLGMDF